MNIMSCKGVLLLAVGLGLGVGSARAEAPSDSQIAAIVVSANQVDIDAGRLAGSRGSTEEIRAFARQMVTDHSGVNQRAVALATRLKLTPQANDTSRALEAGGTANQARLEGLSGVAFDRAYIDHEVAYHQQVLDALDQLLVPNARHAELKNLLIAVRPAFVAHLDHARSLQAGHAAKP